jgi:hypothetical protein
MNTPKKATQSKQSTQLSQTVGKDLYLSSPRAAELTPEERKTLKAMSTAKSLQNLQELDVSTLTVETCFKGTNVQTAMKVDEVATRAALVAMITRTVKFIDANKTLSTPEEISLTINELLKTYPCFTIEDWRLCCYHMAKEVYGPYYERLKLAQFVECFGKYNQAKAPIVQEIRQNEQKEAERELKEAIRYLQPEYATQTNPQAARVSAPEWMRGEDRLTYTEREEMENRAKERKQ